MIIIDLTYFFSNVYSLLNLFLSSNKFFIPEYNPINPILENIWDCCALTNIKFNILL